MACRASVDGVVDDGSVLAQASLRRHVEGVADGRPHASTGNTGRERLVGGALAQHAEHVAGGDHPAPRLAELAGHQPHELALSHAPTLPRRRLAPQTCQPPDVPATAVQGCGMQRPTRRPQRITPGTRVLVTGAARGIGAALATQLAEHGAHVAFTGIEADLLHERAAAANCPAYELDVTDHDAVVRVVDEAARDLGGLDVVVANAGIARQLPVHDGDPRVMERMLEVNTLGAYYTARAAARHVRHPGGYLLLTSSLAAAVQLPLLGAYSTSKAALEALGNTARIEFAPSGAQVGVAYFSELDTEMTSRGFDTEAARTMLGSKPTLSGVGSLPRAIDRIEAGIARRARTVHAPFWVDAVVPVRAIAQRVIEARGFPDLDAALETARTEDAPWTTPQPDEPPASRRHVSGS